jgi:hypothetical protein
MTAIDEILSSISEIQQSRSRFQLEKFVVGQHDTVEMQYLQVCLEINELITSMELAKLEIRKTSIFIDRLKESSDEIDHIEAEKLQISLRQKALSMYGAQRELEILIDIYNSFSHKYTRQEIEDAQPEYWEKRLFRQAGLQAIGQGYVDMAQLDAVKQIGKLETFLENYELPTLGGKEIE